jgi:hypothetical protein
MICMELGKRYVVTRASKDGTFVIGDHVSVNADGSINCKEAQGWIDPSDVAEAMEGMEVEIDREWIDRGKMRLIELLAEFG